MQPISLQIRRIISCAALALFLGGSGTAHAIDGPDAIVAL